MSQTFMNKALVKYNRIIDDGEYGDAFYSSTNNLQQDIVVMLAKANAAKVKQIVLQKKPPRDDANDDVSTKLQDLPPFPKWFKFPTAEGSVEYKLGDTKEYKEKN